jgi:hypothetical protein
MNGAARRYQIFDMEKASPHGLGRLRILREPADAAEIRAHLTKPATRSDL